jgi:hypothetical protein
MGLTDRVAFLYSGTALVSVKHEVDGSVREFLVIPGAGYLREINGASAGITYFRHGQTAR